MFKSNSLSAFLPFASAIDALTNANAISEGIASDQLRNFIATNLPKKLKKFVLGVADPKLGGALTEQLNGLKVRFTWFNKVCRSYGLAIREYLGLS